jgi:hypothetical protein
VLENRVLIKSQTVSARKCKGWHYSLTFLRGISEIVVVQRKREYVKCAMQTVLISARHISNVMHFRMELNRV